MNTNNAIRTFAQLADHYDNQTPQEAPDCSSCGGDGLVMVSLGSKKARRLVKAAQSAIAKMKTVLPVLDDDIQNLQLAINDFLTAPCPACGGSGDSQERDGG